MKKMNLGEGLCETESCLQESNLENKNVSVHEYKSESERIRTQYFKEMTVLRHEMYVLGLRLKLKILDDKRFDEILRRDKYKQGIQYNSRNGYSDKLTYLLDSYSKMEYILASDYEMWEIFHLLDKSPESILKIKGLDREDLFMLMLKYNKVIKYVIHSLDDEMLRLLLFSKPEMIKYLKNPKEEFIMIKLIAKPNVKFTPIENYELLAKYNISETELFDLAKYMVNYNYISKKGFDKFVGMYSFRNTLDINVFKSEIENRISELEKDLKGKIKEKEKLYKKLSKEVNKKFLEV